MGPLDFLNGADAPQLDTPVIDDTPADAITAEAPAEGPARGPDGKFIPKAAAETPQDAPQAETPEAAPPVAEAAPAAPEAPQGPTLEERLAAIERENAGLKTALYQKRDQVRQQRQAPPPPEVWDENDLAYFEQEVAASNAETAQAYQDRLANQSYQFAEREHGAEVMAKVREWASARVRTDPHFNEALLQSDHPFQAAFEAYQADPVIQIEALKQQIASLTAGAPPNPAPAQAPAFPTPPSRPAPPRTLANAPSAGGAAHVPVGPAQAFDGLFS